VVGGNLTARAFTNPRIVHRLVRQTRVPFGALYQELAILAKDSQKWPAEDRETAQELSQTLGGMDWRSSLLASAAADATAMRGPSLEPGSSLPRY
jgi:hypothetical protein